MSAPSRPMPKAMQRKLAALRTACEALPKQQASAPVACPIFGNATPPVPAPLPANLPPLLAQASARLAEALAAPAKPLDGWPFVNPPRVDAYIKQQKAGRPSDVQPNQVVRLARYVRLGRSVPEAAEKAGLPERTARRILAGDHSIVKHPAVLATGVNLPHSLGGDDDSSPEAARRNTAKPPGSDFQEPGNTLGSPDAKNATTALKSEVPVLADKPSKILAVGDDLERRKKVRAGLRDAGISIATWAKHNRFSYAVVEAVLAGRLLGNSGEAHRVCVALKLKEHHEFDPAAVLAEFAAREGGTP